jgi:hypothetical protein
MIEVGNKVVMAIPSHKDKWYNSEAGFGEVWISPNMDPYAKTAVTVVDVNVKVGTFHIEEDGGAWAYPIMSIVQVMG